MNNFNYTRYVLECFRSLPDYCEVIIIDNASKDETKYLKSDKNVTVIRNETNLGFGKAVNQGYEKSSGEIVLFLNNDIKILDKELKFIDKLINDINLTKDPSIFGPTGGFVDFNDEFKFKYETNDSSKPINYMSGWFLAAKKSVFDSLIQGNNIGPFDADTYFVYYEDTDLGLYSIGKNVKFELYSVPVIHFGKKTSSTLDVNKLYNESRLKFIKKWKNILTNKQK